MANMYDHLTDGILTTDEYKLRREKTASRIREIEAKLTKLNSANIEYYLTGAKIFELAEGAHEQYMKQSNEEKRKLLDFVISKCIVKDGKFIPEFRQPFDLFAFYKERERQKVGEKCKKPIDPQLWLGTWDTYRTFVLH